MTVVCAHVQHGPRRAQAPPRVARSQPLGRSMVGIRTGGVALTAGVGIFLASRFRHTVDPDDRMLGALLVVGFAGWLVGAWALRAQYAPASPAEGRAGLVTIVAGITAVAVGHVASFVVVLPGPWFMPIVAGTLVTVVGLLLFGVGALRRDVLPRWRLVPLVAGLVGLGWILFAFDGRPVEGNPEAFLLMRTLFGISWLPLGYIMVRDTSMRQTAEAASPKR